MFNTSSLWFDISIITFFFLAGNIFLGHFEERSPQIRKLIKYMVTVPIILTLSYFFGRWVAFGVLAITLIPIVYVHGIILPRKGINGWTGEPKSRYYDFRGWDKNIFNQ
jgi:hypothetical protein